MNPTETISIEDRQRLPVGARVRLGRMRLRVEEQRENGETVFKSPRGFRMVSGPRANLPIR